MDYVNFQNIFVKNLSYILQWVPLPIYLYFYMLIYNYIFIYCVYLHVTINYIIYLK